MPLLLPNPAGGNAQGAYALALLGSVGGLMVATLWKACTWARWSLTAASALHDRVFAHLLRARMSFFETTPTGRILNRYALSVVVVGGGGRRAAC